MEMIRKFANLLQKKKFINAPMMPNQGVKLRSVLLLHVGKERGKAK